MPKKILAMKRLGLLGMRRNHLKWSLVFKKHLQQTQRTTDLQRQLQRPGIRLKRRAHTYPLEITYNKKYIQTGLSNALSAAQAGKQKGNHSLARSQAGVTDNKTAARVRSITEHQRGTGGGQTWAVGQAEAAVPAASCSQHHAGVCTDWNMGKQSCLYSIRACLSK